MIRVKDGDYNGRFTLPSGEKVHGTLTLGADKPPSVSLHPDDPGDLTQGKSFPQDSRAAELVGYLFSNDEVIIGDAVLSEWLPQHVHASGRWALVGLDITQVPDRRWNTLQVRITGLETLLGRAISLTLWPKDARVDPQRFGADLNTAAKYTSTSNAVTITANYHYSFSPADPYRFSITNYATTILTADQPRTVDEWVKEWMNPLIGLLTLATGERERIASALFSAPDLTRATDDPRMSAEITGQLFGAGIHQQDTPAQRRTRPNGTPLVPLFTLTDAPPLADLIRTWGTGLGERTATTLYRLSMDPTLPPPVRYLLCAQALEALHTEDHAAQENAEDAAHTEDRTAALAGLAAVPDDVLDPSIRRFLKQNVRRRPLRSLARRLSQILATVPNRDTLVATWIGQTEPLVPYLAAHDCVTEPLHERLASIRNVLSHGSATLPARQVHAATRILETLLRGQLLTSLGFNHSQLVNAYTRMTDTDS
jgi:hypothetical protein